MTAQNVRSTITSPTGTPLVVGDGAPLLFILGPCVIESRDIVLRHAEQLAKIKEELSLSLVFKASFDKANRTSISGYRGVGIDEGLKILQEVRESFSLPVLTDIHSPDQVDTVAAVVDVLQIPAFLCRQTDLLVAAGQSEKAVLVKKGQFLAPQDMEFAAKKVSESGAKNIMMCERGACFGYRDLVVDFRSFSLMRETGWPVVFDATHSVQVMGGAGGASSGNRAYVSHLARAAVSYGVDAVFLECHEQPDSAPSDGANMLPLADVPAVCRDLVQLAQLSLETR